MKKYVLVLFLKAKLHNLFLKLILCNTFVLYIYFCLDLVLDNQGEDYEFYPREIDSSKERKFLFKVRVKKISSIIWGNAIRVVQDYVLTIH